MIPLAVAELAGTRLLSGDPGTVIRSVTTDSREAGPGALFCALEGERAEGHDFLDAVRQSTAAAPASRTASRKS